MDDEVLGRSVDEVDETSAVGAYFEEESEEVLVLHSSSEFDVSDRDSVSWRSGFCGSQYGMQVCAMPDEMVTLIHQPQSWWIGWTNPQW